MPVNQVRELGEPSTNVFPELDGDRILVFAHSSPGQLKHVRMHSGVPIRASRDSEFIKLRPETLLFGNLIIDFARSDLPSRMMLALNSQDPVLS